MKIAILSDSHDNTIKFDLALRQVEEAESFIHCGDLCSPFMIKRLGDAAAGRPVHIVWGNNEGDIRLICRLASDYSDFHLHGALAELQLGGIPIAVNHYPEIARGLAASGKYRLVCYGHDHTAHIEKVDDCLLLNPGELLGLQGKATFAWYDTETGQASLVEV